MKKTIAASLIAVLCFAVIATHAWQTWGDTDLLGPGVTQKDRELFEYSLFLESFAFMLSAAYWAGPRIYRLFKEEAAALRFEGEKEKISRTVHIYSALCVVLRRIALDPQMGVSRSETIIAIALICSPAIWAIARRILSAKAKTA
jgi:hypothetical protein